MSKASAVRTLLRQPARIARALRRMGPAGDPLRVPYRWLHKPDTLALREVCLFMTFDPTGVVPRHALHHARAWATHGYDVVIIIAMDDISHFDMGEELDFASGVLLRQNSGYDFGAWASAIRLLPELSKSSRVAIVNDSIYGPFNSFNTMLDHVRGLPADFVGAVESFEFQPHIQSFLIFFNPGALRAPAFWKFWQSVRIGNRDQVVRDYELTLSRRLISAGLKREILFLTPSNYNANPTITRWRELIVQGFPYIKRQVLHDNIYSINKSPWHELLSNSGFDYSMAEEHLSSLKHN